MLKLIKEAQVIDQLGKKIELVKNLQTAFGKQSIVEAAALLSEDEFDMDMDAATLLDKVQAFAEDEGVQLVQLHDAKVFTRFANDVFAADEEEYGSVLSRGERRKLAAQAYQIMVSQTAQENEEQGWPDTDTESVDIPFDDKNADTQDSYDDSDDEHRWPWEEENEESSLEQQGWNDCKAGQQMALRDPDYVAGYERCQRLNLGMNQLHGEEEEDAKPTSVLKSLLNQKKEVAKQANTALKKIESEGAAAFHEYRMKAEKAPYNKTKQSDEHNAWTKGWNRAAHEHYATPADHKVKPKRKK